MSRLSTLPRPRESLFTGGLDPYRGDVNVVCPPNLRECVLAMEDCCEEAHEAQQLLRNGTFDLPRMRKVLENQRVFLLIDEGTVHRYKADLADEIEPQINELIDRAEKGLNALNRREGLIQSKVEAAQAMQSRVATAPTSNRREERRLQLLAKQRRRLEDEVKILESEILALVCTPFQAITRVEQSLKQHTKPKRT
ncbi:Spc19-domain-containing protein [Suillus occidentalis]|nr:Spc19-domain-containing protein [Suillus occidentalis]